MEKKQQSILHLADLLALYLKGEASPAQQAQVERWMEESEDHRRLYEGLQQELNKPEAILQLRDLRNEAILKRIIARPQKPKTKVRSILIWSAAAVLMTFVGLESVRYFMHRKSKTIIADSMAQMEDINGGKVHAILVMSNGRKLDLHPAMDSSIQQSGVTIKLKGDTAQYLASSNNSLVEQQVLQTPKGSTYHMTLADGTGVQLNAGSSIRYPTRFEKERKVEISGEVYFDVAADPLHPFVVKSGKMEVKALGTSFNIRAYRPDHNLATLITGSVQVSQGTENLQLRPGEQVLETTAGLQATRADLTRVSAWREGLFIFEDTSTKEVLEEIERWYDVKIIYVGGFKGEDLYHGEMSRKLSLNKLLAILETTGVAKFTIQGRTIYARPVQEAKRGD